MVQIADNTISLLKKHWPAILAGFFVALCVSLPNVVTVFGHNYKGLPPMETDAETFYWSRIHAAYHGCIMSCNPYIKEYGSLYPSFDPSISEAILALPGIIFKFSIIELKIIYDFLLPFLLSILAYALVFRLTSKRGLSFLGTLCIFLGFNLLNASDLINFSDLWDLLRHLLTGSGSFSTDFLLYARPVNPMWSSVVFLLFLHALFSFIRSSNWKNGIFLLFIYGLSFYTYFYLYSFATTILESLSMVYLFRRDWRNLSRASIVLCLGLILGLPIIRELWLLIHHPFYLSLPIVSSLKSGHFPILTTQGVVLTIVLVVIAIIIRLKSQALSKEYLFFLALFIGSVLVLNERIVTGISVENFHYSWYYITPALVLFICWALGQIQRINALSIFILASIFILNALAIDMSSLNWSKGSIDRDQNYVPVLMWLNSNTPKQSVIFSDLYLSRLVPIFTDDYVFWSPFASGYLTPPDRRVDVAVLYPYSPDFKEKVGKYGINYLVLDRKQDDSHGSYLSYPVLYKDSEYVVYVTGS